MTACTLATHADKLCDQVALRFAAVKPPGLGSKLSGFRYMGCVADVGVRAFPGSASAKPSEDRTEAEPSGLSN